MVESILASELGILEHDYNLFVEMKISLPQHLLEWNKISVGKFFYGEFFRFRSREQDDYFLVNFDHFNSELYIVAAGTVAKN
jgi:hypothetical protein